MNPIILAFVRTRDADIRADLFGKTKPHAKIVTVMHAHVGQLVSDSSGYWHAVTLGGDVIRGDFGYDGWRRALWALLRHVDESGTLPTTPAVPRTRAEWLRYIVGCRQHATPTRVCLDGDATSAVRRVLYPWPSLDSEPKSSETLLGEGRVALAKVVEVIAFQERLCRYTHYVTEVVPGWSYKATHAYADNSEEIEEVARDGRTRRRMVVGPSGDVCF